MPDSGASIKNMTTKAGKVNDCRPLLIGYAHGGTRDGRELPGAVWWRSFTRRGARSTTGNRWSAAQRKATAKAGLDLA